MIDEFKDNMIVCKNIIGILKIAEVAVEASYNKEFVRKYDNVIKELERINGHEE